MRHPRPISLIALALLAATALPAGAAGAAEPDSPDFLEAIPGRAWSARQLAGTPVRNGAEERIGEIHDIFIQADGTVAAVVLGVGGFLGVGTRYVAVPVTALVVEAAEGPTPRLRLSATREQLRAAPAFDPDLPPRRP